MATRKPRRATRARKTKARTASQARGGRRQAAGRSKAAPRRERRQHRPETLRLRSLQPSFTVNDLERSVRFYTDVLGFIVADRWTAGDVLRGVMLKAGASQLGLSQDDWAKGRDRQKGQGMSIWCETVQDVDALAARIKAAGWPLTEEPKDQSWGGRSLAVTDPDGFNLTIYREG
jgi:catechol 2,3-dioxygenase-like lactoylglutathione lyase family enzyme